MAHSKRMSFSSARSPSPIVRSTPTSTESDEWVKSWQGIYARDLIDSRIVSVDANASVEEACDLLLSEDIPCLAIKSRAPDSVESQYLGLFDFADVNAFLTLAATRHTLHLDDLRENPRVEQIVNAARAGRVSVHLVSNLSEKNPLEEVPYDATAMSLLGLFSRGSHRVLVRAPSSSDEFIGIVSDRRLLSTFFIQAQSMPSLQQYLSNSLQSLSLPSLHIQTSIVAAPSDASVLDAMKLMSEQGVSSVAVIEGERGTLLSAVSVTDIGKIVVPSQSNQILSAPLHQFISQIKGPDGSTDGVDKYPVYSVLPSNTAAYAIEKLLATNAHRLFVTQEPSGLACSIASAPSGTLCGIVSIVDILSLFARAVNIPGVDPLQMQRHRRASSSSSHSSKSERDLARSRSSSRTGVRPSPRSLAGNGGAAEKGHASVGSAEALQWAERVPRKD